MSFGEPAAFFLLLATLLGGVLVFSTFVWKVRTLKLFAQNGTALPLLGSLSQRRQVVKAFFALGAFTTLVLALARPYLGDEPKPARVSPADILVVMDVSLSMAANDMQPSRLELAKQEVSGLLDRLDGGRIGLVLFGGSAALRFPLTFDYEAARVLVRSVEVDTAPAPGTALNEGLRTAIGGLQQSRSPVKAVLLLTDGEDFGAPLDDVLQQATAAGITVHALGLGRPEGSNIPLANAPGGGTGVKRDRSGQVVVTKLAEATLQRIAEATNGTYQRASQDGRDLQRTFQRLGALSEEDLSSIAAASANDLTPYFVLAAFLMLLVELLIPERSGTRKPALLPALAALPLALLFLSACVREQDQAYDLNQLGSQLYRASRYFEALDAFRQAQVIRPDLPELNINAGGALYKVQEYDRAVRETQRALTDVEGGLRARAHFNMGNAYFMAQRFQDALEEYKETLREDPNNLEAKINLELTLQRLLPMQEAQDNDSNQNQQRQGQQQPSPNDNPGQQPDQQPQQGNQNQQGGGQRTGTPSNSQQTPGEELRRALREAGQELSIEETLRILDALRERERELQGPYQGRSQSPDSRRGPSRPEKDW